LMVHCLINKVTLYNIVASKKMLLYNSTLGLSVEQMSQQSKHRFHAEIQAKYLKASRLEKV